MKNFPKGGHLQLADSFFAPTVAANWREYCIRFGENKVKSILFASKRTAHNAEISSNILLWKICGNAKFPQSFPTGKLDEITVFYAVSQDQKSFQVRKFLQHYLNRPTFYFQNYRHIGKINIIKDQSYATS